MLTFVTNILRDNQSVRTRWADRATDIEDGGDADFPREFSILDYGCHAEIMEEQPDWMQGR